jgi:hypothetical protein
MVGTIAANSGIHYLILQIVQMPVTTLNGKAISIVTSVTGKYCY